MRGARLLELRTDAPAGPLWAFDAALAAALGVGLLQLEQHRPPADVASEGEWATTLVIALLTLRYHDRADRWAPIVEARRNATPPQLMRAGMETVCALKLAAS